MRCDHCETWYFTEESRLDGLCPGCEAEADDDAAKFGIDDFNEAPKAMTTSEGE